MVLYSENIGHKNAGCIWKKIGQEEKYCTITEQEIKQNTWPNVFSDDMPDIFKRINEPGNTRFIQLICAKGDDVHLRYTGLRQPRPQTTTRSYSKRKTKMKQPLVHNKRQCFIPTTSLNNLQQYIDKNWPKGNDTKDDFCQGIHQLLDIESDSTMETVPRIVCDKEPMLDDVRSILDIVQQKFPTKLEKVRKALIGID